MNVKDLIDALQKLPPQNEVFFRRVPPICGNIESAEIVYESVYGSFGVTLPCVIIGGYEEAEKIENEAAEQSVEPDSGK